MDLTLVVHVLRRDTRLDKAAVKLDPIISEHVELCGYHQRRWETFQIGSVQRGEERMRPRINSAPIHLPVERHLPR